MFRRETTEIKPCYGLTLQQVIAHVYRSSEYINCLIGWQDSPEECLSENPFAIKVLEQHPDVIRLQGLSQNPHMDAIYLQKQQYGKFELGRFMSLMTHVHVDTFLTENVGLSLVTKSILSANPFAFSYLQKHPQDICWKVFSRNPAALDLLEENIDEVDFQQLCFNPNPRAIALLQLYPERVDWPSLCRNSCDEAVDFLIAHKEKLDYRFLTWNTNPRALQLVRTEADPAKWNLTGLCHNTCPLALEMLAQQQHRIDWSVFCRAATTASQFVFLEANMDRVSWSALSENPSRRARALLEANPEKIHWWNALRCHDLFETITEYDYAGIRGARRDLHQEFHAWAGHPSKMTTKWKDWGFDEAIEEAD